jgi:hypothetical protein
MWTGVRLPRPRPQWTTMRWPVMNPAPSEARKLTVCDVAGSSIRPAGTEIYVGGATVFTVMPNGASSGQLRVRPICAYKTEPTRPETMLARTHQPVASPGQTEGEL